MAARFDYATCEPFRAWNRLEPRARKNEFDRALRAEVHDPLWMLTRQWQFGEFQGEDTGSPILTKLQVQYSRISKVQAGQSSPQPYAGHIPLEALIEGQPARFDYRARVQAGRQWMKILDQHGEAFNQGGSGDPAYIKADYLNALLAAHPITEPEIDEDNDSPSLQVQKARLITNRRLGRFLHAIEGRAFDGIGWLVDLEQDANAAIQGIEVHASHHAFLQQVAGDYMAWCDRRFGTGSSGQSAWNGNQLEYQFACAVPNGDGENTVLQADEYYQGKLDWFAFEVDEAVPGDSPMRTSTAEEEQAAILTETLTLIPSEANFAGMPNPRWWEFEDGRVDLGNLTSETTDLAKVLLAEFALVYSNDWYCLPYSLPAGSLSRITGIVVTDVFGEKTFVKSATQGESSDWASWGMFNLSTRQANNSVSLPADTRLFMPPAIAKVQESEAEEEVRLLRDEMANMVWAIETRIADLLGSSRDGHALASELVQYLEELEQLETIAADPVEGTRFYYKLANTVPENWIPFMPVHVGDQNRAIRLQRASMPRRFRDAFQAVRPQTDILRVGMRKDPATDISPFINPGNDIQDNPYYINEEEVPKSGIRISSSYQRTRWYNGRVFNWYGRRKVMGGGEASSGLQFDRVAAD